VRKFLIGLSLLGIGAGYLYFRDRFKDVLGFEADTKVYTLVENEQTRFSDVEGLGESLVEV
jgi:hypothetical protein